MKSSAFYSLALSLLLEASEASRFGMRANVARDTETTCQTLRNAYPTMTYFTNETEYTTLNQGYWTASAWLGPACIFEPSNAEVMSYAVKTISSAGVQFAIQGGGHMPISDAANIGPQGIMISGRGLNQLILSEDGSTLSVGPGNRWGNVYEFLEGTGKMIVGGRLGIVGVPGFLLGGGISFFSYEHGWASANIASFETVLADGSIVNATADNEYSDLFWSLRGGGNSFGIVTNFEMKTYDYPGVTVGNVNYEGHDLRDQYLQTIYDYAHDGMNDVKAALTPTVSRLPGSSDLEYSAMVFYNGNDTNPPAMVNFTGNAENSLPVNSSTIAYRSMNDWCIENAPQFEQVIGYNFHFHIVSMKADLEAMRVVFDTFFEESEARLSNITGAFVTLAPMPISANYITANRGDDCSGDPFGIDATKGPMIWVEQLWAHANTADTAQMEAAMDAVNSIMYERLAELGDVVEPFLYLNDADYKQDVFAGYDAANVEKLETIRAKYDPDNVYTEMMPGGFKLPSSGRTGAMPLPSTY